MDVERRVLLEDRALELPQRLAGLDAELLDERPARALVDGERVGLAAGAVERQHQLAADALAQWLLGDEALELADELDVAPERELRVGAVFERRQPQLLQPQRLELRQIRGRSAPEVERPPERLGRPGRVSDRQRRAAGLRQALELEDVDRSGVDREAVAGRRGLEQVRRQELAELRDVDLERVARRVRRVLTPERVDQVVSGDDPVRLQQERREQRPALLAAELDRRPVDGRRQGAEEAENRLHRGVLARFQAGFSVSSAPCETLVVWMDLEEWAFRGVFRPDA